jgi:GT2 family glycosyltransferase
MFFLKKNKMPYTVSIEGGSNVSVVRHKCLGLEDQDVAECNSIAPFHNKIDYSHIMWIDSDSIFTPEDVINLLNRDKDIVSGLVKKTPFIYAAGKMDPTKNFFQKESLTDDDVQGTELIESDGVGLAFMLVKKGVFESIKAPWFATTAIDEPTGPNGKIYVGEDIYFCIKAKEAGYKIWLDPTVKVGHLKMGVL